MDINEANDTTKFDENKNMIHIFKFRVSPKRVIIYSICGAVIIATIILISLSISSYFYPKKIILPKVLLASSVASSSTTSSQPEDPVTLSLKEYVNKNKQVVGWLKIENTHIDEPILQDKDDTKNDFYLRRDYTKNYNYYGSIFMDYRCNFNPFGRNTILYGHTIDSPYKFYDLKKYQNLSFCNQNPIIELTTISGNNILKSKWKIFAVYTVSANEKAKSFFYYIQTDFASDNEYMDWLMEMKNKSYFDFDVNLTPNDKILTLSTCAYDYSEERLAVNAKLVQDGEALTIKPATVNADRDKSGDKK